MYKNKSGQKGYILIESIICIIIFSISSVVILSFLERVYFIEKIQQNTSKIDKNYFYIIDDIEKLIKKRIKENFYYKGITSDFYFDESRFIFKSNSLFYEIYWGNNKLYISSSEKLGFFRNRKKLISYDEILVNLHENNLYLNITFGNEKILKIINLN